MPCHVRRDANNYNHFGRTTAAILAGSSTDLVNVEIVRKLREHRYSIPLLYASIIGPLLTCARGTGRVPDANGKNYKLSENQFPSLFNHTVRTKRAVLRGQRVGSIVVLSVPLYRRMVRVRVAETASRSAVIQMGLQDGRCVRTTTVPDGNYKSATRLFCTCQRRPFTIKMVTFPRQLCYGFSFKATEDHAVRASDNYRRTNFRTFGRHARPVCRGGRLRSLIFLHSRRRFRPGINRLNFIVFHKKNLPPVVLRRSA